MAALSQGTIGLTQDGAVVVPPPPTSDSPLADDNYSPRPRVPLDLPADAPKIEQAVEPPPAPAIAVPPAPPAANSQADGTYRFANPVTGKEWVMTITPAARQEAPLARAYREAYDAVPYHRAEYLANPAYRHEAAMEFVFGQQRPTVIQKTQSAERVVNPIPVVERPYLYSRNELYGLYPRLRYGAWAETPFIPAPIP